MTSQSRIFTYKCLTDTQQDYGRQGDGQLGDGQQVYVDVLSLIYLHLKNVHFKIVFVVLGLGVLWFWVL